MAFNQKEYIGKYNKKNYKSFLVRIRNEDVELLDKLASVSSVNGYICSLINKDMSPSPLTIKEIKDRALPILKKHGIHEVYLFGSYARGEASAQSDVDIYCESGDVKTFFEQEVLEEELQISLEKDVDLVFFGSRMDEYFKEQLEGDKIKIG